MKNFTCVSVEAVKDKINTNETVIVDVRDAIAYEQSHLPGARHLTNENFSDFLQHIPKNSPVIIYCYHGFSSQAAAKYLVEQGYDNVASMTGGFAAWQQHYPEALESNK